MAIEKLRTRKTAALLLIILMVVVSLAWAEIKGDPEKIPGWVAVYENDTSGNRVDGQINRLVRAVESGADIKIGIGFATGGTPSGFRYCDTVSLFAAGGVTHVGCENNNISLVQQAAPLIVRPTPYHTYEWFDTSGQYVLARASIYGGQNLGQAVDTIPARWYARVR